MEKISHKQIFNIPEEVAIIEKTLRGKGFEAYLIGGCVRDLIIGKRPKDWDITTNATPDDIMSIFSDTFYENNYGTVGIVNRLTEDETLKYVEITPYRTESAYSDKRRPDEVKFSKNIEDDLKRRDFTMNAIALSLEERISDGKYKGHTLDYYKGHDDLRAKIIRTVGDADERFNEDALRIIRAIRFSAELGFVISNETLIALEKNAHLLKHVAKERIRDEFTKIIMSDNPMIALVLSHRLGILKYILPKLEESVGIEQNHAHKYDVFEHLLRALQHAADKGYSLEVRLAALFHDISKPYSRRKGNVEEKWTFHGHEVVGSRETAKILNDLRFPVKLIEKVVKLVRWHMFFSDTEQITPSAVRRMIANVGPDNIWDLIDLRTCDRIGTGRPKENPYRLRKYKSMIEEVLRDPISVGMLKIDGNRLMEISNIPPSPKIGLILNALLEEVLDDPKLNNTEYLENKAIMLAEMPEIELKKLADAGKKKKEEKEEMEINEIRSKHSVK